MGASCRNLGAFSSRPASRKRLWDGVMKEKVEARAKESQHMFGPPARFVPERLPEGHKIIDIGSFYSFSHTIRSNDSLSSTTLVIPGIVSSFCPSGCCVRVVGGEPSSHGSLGAFFLPLTTKNLEMRQTRVGYVGDGAYRYLRQTSGSCSIMASSIALAREPSNSTRGAPNDGPPSGYSLPRFELG